MNAEVALIGGTGLYDLAFKEAREMTINTVYGDVDLIVGRLGGRPTAFLPRHKKGHSLPPHLVNYRANISGLKQIGIKRIFATASTGSLNMEMEPGHFVLLDQFIDFTKSRPLTFYEGGSSGVVHTDMTEPYCPQLRGVVISEAEQLPIDLHHGGVYVCTEGPRFETPAEIQMYKRLGGDLVGMTNVPEVVLAREAGICYSTVAVVTNFAAGISPQPLSHAEVVAEMEKSIHELRELLAACAAHTPDKFDCRCGRNE